MHKASAPPRGRHSEGVADLRVGRTTTTMLIVTQCKRKPHGTSLMHDTATGRCQPGKKQLLNLSLKGSTEVQSPSSCLEPAHQHRRVRSNQAHQLQPCRHRYGSWCVC
jgi:hypothetical protein